MTSTVDGSVANGAFERARLIGLGLHGTVSVVFA